MTDDRSKFTSEPNLVVDDYRPMSITAVASLILGIKSAAAMFNLYLMIIPLAGVIVGVISMVKLRGGDRRASGVWFATSGLGLSLLFGSFAVTYSMSRNQRIYNQSEDHCQEWFALIQEDRLYEAFELRLRYQNRRMAGVDLTRIYTTALKDATLDDLEENRRAGSDTMMTETIVPGSPKMELDTFYGSEPMQTLVANAKRGELKLLRNELMHRDGYLDEVTQVYRFIYKDEHGLQREVDMRIILERWRFPAEGHYHWNILRVEPIESNS